MLRKIARPLLNWFGLHERAAHLATESNVALRRIARRGLDVATVIDVGASNGSWSADVMTIFPLAQYLLIEAQDAHLPALQDFVKKHPNSNFVLKAAGSELGFIYFDADTLFGGQAHRNPEPGFISIPVTTVDHEIATRGCSGPYLLKLDVHGYEIPILKGATQVLSHASLVVIECYNFLIAEESLLFYDMCRHMHALGFRVIDISEPLWRLRDGAFWQIDFFFVPSSRPEFQFNTYR
jgi:FkbM family methyltransferase